MKRIISLFMILALLAVFSGAAAAAFTDVPDAHPYKSEIEFCRAKGYVTGLSDTIFSPESNLTRAQFAVVWARFRLLHETNPNFTDLSTLTKYYDTASLLMYGLGLMKGTSPTTFSPDGSMTREQVAVIAVRTFKLGVANEDDYMKYADYELISDWAQDAVSACINAGVLDGLYDGENFQPQKAVTRAEICRLMYNFEKPPHTVTIAPLTGGTITAEPTRAREGTTINLTITPDDGKQLKADTLKYNETAITGTSFTMPDEDVVVSAEFEDIPVVLESIRVKEPPDNTAYTVGETLDLSGLVIEAAYSDDSTAEVTGYTTEPAEGSALDTAGTMTVTVSYTEGDVTVETTFEITVT